MTQFYKLDAIISAGYRVNGIRAIQFRQNNPVYNYKVIVALPEYRS